MKRYNIRYSICRFKICFNKDFIIPENKNSGIRGIIGQELLKRNCIGNRKCEECAFTESCISYNFMNLKLKRQVDFLANDRIPPYIIICNDTSKKVKKNQSMEFFITFFGDCITMIPEIIRSVNLAGKDFGLFNCPFTLKEVVNDEYDFIFNAGIYKLENIKCRIVEDYVNYRINSLDDDIFKFKIITPLRIKDNGKFNDDLSEESLIKMLIRRIDVMNALEGNEVYFKENKYNLTILDKELSWKENKRYSNRQNSKMSFGGIMGQIKFKCNDIELMKMFIACEILHIGKNSSFGLGAYFIE